MTHDQTEIEHGAHQISDKLRAQGFKAYWAGGYARDRLLGQTAHDIDIATDATPDQLLDIFPKGLTIGRQFGVIIVVLDHHQYEIATFRKDGEYKDGRRPEQVRFSSEEEDARRRDFTVNGMFYDPAEGTIKDYVGGREDLTQGIIRTIGRPEDRFNEDYLRMLRAVRFASTLQFTIEQETWNSIKKNAHKIEQISKERIRDEVVKLLLRSPRAGQGLAILLESGLLHYTAPEIEAMHGQEQPPQFHPEGDVFTHTVMMLDEMETDPPLILALAVLLHDVGKPPTARVTIEEDGSERVRFNTHASVGAEMARDVLKRLRFSNHVIDSVTHCVNNHMRFMNIPDMRESKLRQLVGAETFSIEEKLHELDCKCSHGDLSNLAIIREYRQKWASEPVLPPPLVSGRDLLEMGIKEGPEIGRWLKKTYEKQLGDTRLSKKHLLRWLNSEMNGQQRE